MCCVDEINSSQVTLNTDNIIWESDKDKFKTSTIYKDSSDFTRQTKRGDDELTLPEVTDPHLIVWMRTAGLPTFKKLYAVIDEDIKSTDQLKFSVTDNFDVKSFGGRKYLVIATTSILGGKNTFLQWAYIIVGCLCLLSAALFGIKHKTNPRKPGDLSYWEKNHAH